MGRGLQGGGEQAAALSLEPVELVEESDLAVGIELIDVIDRQLQRVLHASQRRVAGGIVDFKTAGGEQMAFSRSRFAPQVAGERAAGEPGGEFGQRLRIAASDEIIQRRRVGGQQIEQQLLHDEVSEERIG